MRPTRRAKRVFGLVFITATRATLAKSLAEPSLITSWTTTSSQSTEKSTVSAPRRTAAAGLIVTTEPDFGSGSLVLRANSSSGKASKEFIHQESLHPPNSDLFNSRLDIPHSPRYLASHQDRDQ